MNKPNKTWKVEMKKEMNKTFIKDEDDKSRIKILEVSI